MPTIYLDVLIALNWLVDGLLLRATAFVRHLPVRRSLLVLASFIGGISSCIILVPSLPLWLSWLYKLFAVALMSLIAFFPLRPKELFKNTVVLFAISALFAGIATAVWFFVSPPHYYVENGVVYYETSPVLLVVLTVVSYGVLRLFARFTQRRAPQNLSYTLKINLAQTVSVPALCDTGLHLTEPFSGAPVIIVCDTYIRDYLPTRGLRMIPYETVGGNGLLPAFKPDGVFLCGGGQIKEVTGVYVAAVPHLGRGEYGALFGCDLIEA